MGSGGMHTYQKLWTYIKCQSSKLQEHNRMFLRKWSNTSSENGSQEPHQIPIRIYPSPGIPWKELSYIEAGIHTALGFVLVTTIAYAIPDVIHNPTRLAIFWMYIFTYLFLGLLTFLGLFQNSISTVKGTLGAFIFLQLIALLTSSRLISQCNAATATLLSLSLEDKKLIGDCRHASFISSWILIPLFIHTVVFSFVGICYILKFKDNSSNPIVPNQRTHHFANIKIIIEEVV